MEKQEAGETNPKPRRIVLSSELNPAIQMNIDAEIKPTVQPDVKEIECGCGPGRVLVYDKFVHTLYTFNNEEVTFGNAWIHRCEECDNVSYPDDVGDKLYKEIRMERTIAS